ncbi:unnamed protein product [Adineta steineri]|uniref:G-protein coupled receptors family 1 profile domain-containing protein n=1 Tax=Adineta steineri TaxID=433720 RepID=A0A815NM28_9BILA|nr:unnamed protein product [Adineta steineri]CAF1440108.1 unnamed protein product [Adineta steineri]
MILVTNSCFAGFIFTLILFWVTMSTLYNDLQQIYYQDLFCNFRAIHSYLIVIYPTRLFWQSAKFQFSLIILTWIAAFIYACPQIATNAIKYSVDDQICQLPLHFSLLAIYNLFCIYILPINGIVFIYLKLIRYVTEMNKCVTLVNILLRAKKQLKLVFRIFILVSIFLTLGVPYTIFVYMGFFTSTPQYHFRIAVTFIEISLVFVIIALFKFTGLV